LILPLYAALKALRHPKPSSSANCLAAAAPRTSGRKPLGNFAAFTASLKRCPDSDLEFVQRRLAAISAAGSLQRLASYFTAASSATDFLK
jgi:hypothetical protein